MSSFDEDTMPFDIPVDLTKDMQAYRRGSYHPNAVLLEREKIEDMVSHGSGLRSPGEV
jgi:hypothetical protein